MIFLPVIHTTDKKGNEIDKLACSEFWKEKDSYRQLQNAFYEYMVSHNFELERGLPKEETNRKHIDLAEYKELTNFENTKKLIESISYDIPEETDIKDLKKFMFNKNEKILNDVIKPKEEIIKELAIENKSLKKELSKQSKIVNEATKYQKERDSIIADNRALHNKVDNLENEYKKKSSTLEWEYENKYNKLEKENNRLYKIIDRFYTTIEKFIEWICNKFNFGESKELIRNFEKETNTFIDPVKQITKEEREKEWDREL